MKPSGHSCFKNPFIRTTGLTAETAYANRDQTENAEECTQNGEDHLTAQNWVLLPGGNTAGRAPGVHTDSNAA